MDKRKKALLIGLILGDGHLNAHSGVALEIEHGSKQKSYLEYKANLLVTLLGGKLPSIYHRIKKDTYKISKGHRYFRILYKWIYKSGEKRFSRKMLNYLTPEAIALWWMDDGSHSKDYYKGTKKIRSHSFYFYTMTNPEDTQNIIDFFKEKYDINFYPIKKLNKKGEIRYYLKCRTREGRKWSSLLRPYILPEFEYKLMSPEE